MRAQYCLSLALLLGVAVALADGGAALAIPANGTTNASHPNNLKMQNPTKLSADECTQLGGTIRKTDLCLSGQECNTQDESGNWHAVCLKKQN